MTNTTPQGAIAHRLLRRKQVEQAIGLSRSTIYARLDTKSPHAALLAGAFEVQQYGG